MNGDCGLRSSECGINDGQAERVAGKAAELLQNGRILADGRKVKIFPGARQVKDILLPLLNWCREQPGPKGRGLVGIAAPAGAGKTVLCAWLNAVAQAAGYREFGFLSLDGYHFPNAILDARGGARCPQRAFHHVPCPQGARKTAQRDECAGDIRPHPSLCDLKGTPQTFNAARLLADLRKLKAMRDEQYLPAYSRELHDPVEGAVRIGPEISWVFVEGNFLFLDEPPWREIRGLFDRRIFIDGDDGVLKERLAARHALAGRSAEWVAAHYARTDGPNTLLARSSARYAEVTLVWDKRGGLKCREGKPPRFPS